MYNHSREESEAYQLTFILCVAIFLVGWIPMIVLLQTALPPVIIWVGSVLPIVGGCIAAIWVRSILTLCIKMHY